MSLSKTFLYLCLFFLALYTLPLYSRNTVLISSGPVWKYFGNDYSPGSTGIGVSMQWNAFHQQIIPLTSSK